ncbi:hypothetical protein GUJ93_ZPchr0011g27295 [Zizania palustris]|uniref:Uncharacterized protein n=1 Tax=Zizania palustris TaxID=103762 RepID=A0A8J5WIA7_ZIZPA|nr:hypothetical protein GUJ93_ZPchr0011g27295 [Zizania palustris]
MALPMKLLLLCEFLLLILLHGEARPPEKCAAASLEVEVSNTGDKVGYDPVFEVTVRNRCVCAVRGVHLCSEGFASSVAVDPRLFRRDGQDYLVADGRRVEPAATVSFRYAWDRAFRMTPSTVQDDCT